MADRLVVIGGDGAGMAAASNARRLRADLEIVAFERGSRTSYSACGIPYLVAGEIDDVDKLVARTPREFRESQRIDVRTEHEVTEVDAERRQVEVRDRLRDRTFRIGFDHLVIATGARPIRPDLPGIDHESVFGVQTLDDAERLLAYADACRCQRVVVVGGGYIGLEMAEAFVMWGAEVTIVDSGPHVMRTLDADIAELVGRAVQRLSIDLRTGVAVTGFEPGQVHTDQGSLPADLVVLGLGVEPETTLADEAGLALGARRSIRVDRRQQTAVEGIWAAGDCAESFHLVSQRPVHVALGTVANRHGRVAGINIGGGYATFPGVVGTAITRICGTEVARTGLTLFEAERDGFEVIATTIESTTQAGYMADADPLTVKLVSEARTGRLLGGQIVGGRGAGLRIDTLAAAVTAGFTVDELVNLDLAYAPPFSPLWDPVATAARVGARRPPSVPDQSGRA
jgi:NADPH-dependent 2,4-dienoyl-CoA reductase/sulfur reductase-like enzyme